VAAAVDRHGVEDDEHQDHGQQLADEQAEEPERTGGRF
jgi:hypothetical protein